MRVLQTPRLLLRWFTADDAAFIVELLNDPGWKRFIGERGVHNEDDARAWIAERLVASYWKQGFGLWAMQRLDDGALVGMCGLVKRDTLPGIDVGYALLPRYRGMGYVREGAGACLPYGAEVLGLEHILAITREDNTASIRVLESFGMVLQRKETLAGNDHPSLVFAWHPPTRPAPQDDAARIDGLVARFYAAFRNSGGATHRVASLPLHFLPAARIVKMEGDRTDAMDMQAFAEPRAALLEGGRLVDFSESEHTHHTDIDGRLAQRRSHYRKAGRLDGEAFDGAGTKLLQMVRTEAGWKIGALAWQDG